MSSSTGRTAPFVAALVIFAAGLLVPVRASAYTLKTLYSFCAGGGQCTDGKTPNGIVTDAAGNIYGTTTAGGIRGGQGVVYELVPNADKSAWSYQEIYQFCVTIGCPDGRLPGGRLVIDRHGSLYGTTIFGGANRKKDWSGTVFKLTPNADRSHWDFTSLYSFCSNRRCLDGAAPNVGLSYVGQASGAVYDGHAPLFGIAQIGGGGLRVVVGKYGRGVAFELVTRHGQIAERVIHDFCVQDDACSDGGAPLRELLAGADGTLYGGANGGTGFDGAGVVYSLQKESGHKFNYSILYDFCMTTGCPDGAGPTNLVLGPSGSLLGVAGNGGTGAFCPNDYGCGVVFQLAPNGPGWQQSVLYNFCQQSGCLDGGGPLSLGMDASGNLLGTTLLGGGNASSTAPYGGGVVFSFNGGYSPLYSFCAQTNCADGSIPMDATPDA